MQTTAEQTAAPAATTTESPSPSAAPATEGTASMPSTATDAAPNAEASTTPEPANPVVRSPEATSRDLTREEVLEFENVRLRKELAAFAEKLDRARALTDEVDKAEELYEAAKAEAKSHKEDRDEAKEALRKLLAGDVEVEIDFSKPAEEPAKVEAPKPTVAEKLAARPVHNTYGVAQFALTRDAIEKLDASAVRPLEPSLDKRKVDALHAGPLLFLPLEQECFGDESGAFVCWPLIDAESWAVNYATKYAEAMGDLVDEAPDVKARRRAGGELCGMLVKVKGQRRKRFVIGPDDQAVRFLYGTGGAAVEATCEAARYLPASLPAEKTGEVLAFPERELADRIEARLREYEPIKATGYHEGMAEAIAGDLRVSAEDVVRAAKADSFRFEVRAEDIAGTSREVVRLLLDADQAKPAADPDGASEPEVLGGAPDEATADSPA